MIQLALDCPLNESADHVPVRLFVVEQDSPSKVFLILRSSCGVFWVVKWRFILIFSDKIIVWS